MRAATVLLGDDDLTAQVAQHIHCGFAHARLVVIGAAPVEVDHLGEGRRGLGRGGLALEPGPEALAREAREGGVAADAQRPLGKAAQQLVLNGQV